MGSLQKKKIKTKKKKKCLQIKNFDFVNSQQSCFTVQNADILFIGNTKGFFEI